MGQPSWAGGPPAPAPPPLSLTLALSTGRNAAAASSSGDHPDAAPAASTSPASVRRHDSPLHSPRRRQRAAATAALSASAPELPHRPPRAAAPAAAARAPTPTSQPGACLEEKMPARRRRSASRRRWEIWAAWRRVWIETGAFGDLENFRSVRGVYMASISTGGWHWPPPVEIALYRWVVLCGGQYHPPVQSFLQFLLLLLLFSIFFVTIFYCILIL